MRKLVLFERWRQSFNQVKEELSQPTTLVLYDPKRELKVSADVSSFGLGAVLFQQDGDN